MDKIFNFLVISIATILSVFSIVTFSVIQIDLLSYSLELTPNGITKYLEAFGNYKELFSATAILIIAYFGILRLRAAETANIDKRKQDRYNDWKLLCDLRITEVEKNNPYLKREFARLRQKLFEDLYKIDFSITDNDQLKLIINDKIKGMLRFLEELNSRAVNMGLIYPSQIYSYFYNDFEFIFLGCLNEFYDELPTDLKQIFLSCQDENRMVNEQLYMSAQQNYLQRTT